MEDLEMLREIGRGGFATVYLCRDKASNRLVALKQIPLHRIQTPEQKRRAEAEQFVLANACHAALSRGVRPSFQDATHLSLVMEFVEDARPLYQCIWRFRSTRAFPERIAKYFAAQLVVAVEQLHALGVLHRDLKSGNVLVDKRGVARVIDYGFAKRLDESESSDTQRTFSVCGTHYIMAPEVYLRQPSGVEVDWWGVGVIVHEMVCGRPPWAYKPAEDTSLASFFDCVSEVAKGFSRGQEASALLAAADVSHACKAFIRELLQFNPRKRLGHAGGASQVKAHAWLQDVDWDVLFDVASPYDPVQDYLESGPLHPQAAIAPSSSSSAESIDADDNVKFFGDF